MVVAKAGFLFPGPLRDRVRRLIAETPADAAHHSGHQLVADRLGITERRVRVYLGITRDRNSTGLLRVETVDKAFCRLGEHITDAYGPLLALPETDACGEKCSRCRLELRSPAELCGFCVEEGSGHAVG